MFLRQRKGIIIPIQSSNKQVRKVSRSQKGCTNWAFMQRHEFFLLSPFVDGEVGHDGEVEFECHVGLFTQISAQVST